MVAMHMMSGFRPVTRNRTMRDLVTSSITARISPRTTPTPPIPWTTVLADFGPVGVSNPKALVSKDYSIHNSTVVFTHPIGPSGRWQAPQTHTNRNYTIYRISQMQPFRLQNYRDMCWETQIGQEITKLVVMDLLMTIAAILVIDFFRGLICRYCNLWWFWNLEKTFPEYGEFKVAENVLHLVNNQVTVTGMIWLGLFFVPMLPMINNVKLIILMYIRGWAVMTCNVPARQIFRASRSSNFYLMLLLLMLFLCTLPVGYVIASRKPSKSCGPFGSQPHFYSVITDVLHENLNESLVDAIKYMVSPGIVIPALLLLLLVIYFLLALVRGLREANNDLSTQLMHERTEEKKKIFEMAGGKKRRNFTFTKTQINETKQNHVPYSSDDESHHRSIASNPRSTTSASRGFVPSLGSLEEDDHSDAEEVEPVKVKSPKLTILQQFLICIGLADPKTYVSLLKYIITIL
ncbi:TMC domain protein [Dictyocaulus viviparus]|uniref:TMC domain protein n=1 Tax=Dictyocaulus viviparus TaxID=29172 RepID=A0A0D8XDL2_DICVI|nr:TMC domain protein [Dictyocaulus viviparus]